MNTRTTLAASALIAAGLVALTGCSAFDQIAHKQATSTFDDVDGVDEGTDLDAGWLPSDATAITVRTSTIDDAADAVILLASTSPLTGDCSEVERRSAPSWTLDGAPDVYDADTVFACGDWSVIPTDDGWYGWTPNSAEERSAALAD